MPRIHSCKLPSDALLSRYRESGAYTDCYCADVQGVVSHAEYVEAFYSTWLFKVERQLLEWLVSKPSTDAQATALAAGRIDAFAAWNVEARSAAQLLLTDFQGRTRSWLMSAAVDVSGVPGTRLYFGSAVVPLVSRNTGRARMGTAFRVLLGFHKLYSRMLLGAARARLEPHTARRVS